MKAAGVSNYFFNKIVVFMHLPTFILLNKLEVGSYLKVSDRI